MLAFWDSKERRKKKGTDTACDVTALIWGHSDQVTELLSKWRQNRRILRTRFFERWRNSFVHLFTKKVINLYTFSLTAKIKLKHTLPKKRERYKYQIYAISLPWQKCFQINQKKKFLLRGSRLCHIFLRGSPQKKTYFTLPYFVRPNDNYLPSNSDRNLDKQRQ